MTKGLKVFNVILIIVLVAVALCALVSAVYWIIDAFKITALFGVKDFIFDNMQFIILGTGSYAIDFLATQITVLASVKTYILIGFAVLLCAWAIILLVKITKPEDHFCKFRPCSFVINLIFALFFILNIHYAFESLLAGLSVATVMPFVVSLLGIAILVIHLNMNLCGRYSMKEDHRDPNDIFPNRPVQPQQPVVHPQPNYPPHQQPSQFGAHINAQPPRRMPPPPPPQA